MTIYQILVCFLLSWILKANGSHFRGASITWAPTGKGTEISISYRISWRSDFGDDYRCDNIRVQNQVALSGQGDMQCFSACTMSQPLSYTCTGFDVDNNWSTGRNTFKYDPGTKGVIKFGYQGYAWTKLKVGGSGYWRLVVTADTRERPDTGKINSSPTVDVLPVLDLQYNCEHEIKLPVNDPDGDIVKCRFATNDTDVTDECKSICNSFPRLMLDEDTCTLSYNAVYDTGLYAVAIQVEDFAPGDLVNPLSSVPVQFLVNVYNTARECGSGPVFVPPTPEDGETFDLNIGATFNLNITASSSLGFDPRPWRISFAKFVFHQWMDNREPRWDEQLKAWKGCSGCSGITIARNPRNVEEIITIEPVGLQKSDPEFSSEGTTRFLSIGVSWTPTQSDVGLNTFCFKAKDNDRITGPQRCVTLNVLEKAKCITDCKDLPDGNYQSCKSCAVYASCVNGLIHDYRNCAPGRLFWDDNSKTCEAVSTTCPDESPFPCVDDCKGINGGPFPSCDTCSGFILCVYGYKYEMPCVGNLKYDAFAKGCVNQEHATCTV